MSRTTRIVLVVSAFMAAALSNGYYAFVVGPCDKAAQLTSNATHITSTLEQSRIYMEGFSEALEAQATSGQPVAQAVLDRSEQLANESDSALKEAEAAYTSIENEARTEKLPIDRGALLFGHTTIYSNSAMLGTFREQITSIQLTSRVQILRQHLQQEEAVVARTLASLSDHNGEGMSQRLWDDICQRRGCVAHILQEVQERADMLTVNKTGLCKKHRQEYQQALDELRKKAETLKLQLEGIRRRDQVANNDSTAA